MKKTFKTALSLLMALALVMSLAVTAFAQAAQPAADIVYQGEKKLVITPKDGHHTDTDLFGKFKGALVHSLYSQGMRGLPWRAINRPRGESGWWRSRGQTHAVDQINST